MLTGLSRKSAAPIPDAWPAARRRSNNAAKDGAGSPSPPATNSATPSSPACAAAAGRRRTLVTGWILRPRRMAFRRRRRRLGRGDGWDAPGGVGTPPLASPKRLPARHERIRDYIAAGDCYQVNFTFPPPARPFRQPAAFYCPCCAALPAGAHGASSPTPAARSCPASARAVPRTPRLHPRQPADEGTLRGHRPGPPGAASAKDRAENVMIVDLIRNDMGRLHSPGGVRVEDLCRIEPYPTVWQMTFPRRRRARTPTCPPSSGAVSPVGRSPAPWKIRAMEIIRELETAPRGLYCGASAGSPWRRLPLQRADPHPVPEQRRRPSDVGSGVVFDSLPDCRVGRMPPQGALPHRLPKACASSKPCASSRARAFRTCRAPRTHHRVRRRVSGFCLDPDAFRCSCSPGVEADTPRRVRVTSASTATFTSKAPQRGAPPSADRHRGAVAPVHRQRRPAAASQDHRPRPLRPGNSPVMAAGHLTRSSSTSGRHRRRPQQPFVERDGVLLTPRQRGPPQRHLRRRLLRKAGPRRRRSARRSATRRRDLRRQRSAGWSGPACRWTID